VPTKSPEDLGVKLENVRSLEDFSKSLFLNTLAISCLLSRFWRRDVRHRGKLQKCNVKKTWILDSLSEKNRVEPAHRKQSQNAN